MNKQLKIKGMHCESCKALITMEIEDLNLGEKVDDIQIQEDNTGVITLSNVSEEDVEQIVNSVNSMDQYEVIK